MQRKVSIFPQPLPEPQWLDSWHGFDHCAHSSLLIILTTFPYKCLHLFISSSTVYHSRKGTVPRLETIPRSVQVCPSTGSSKCNQQRRAIISSCQGEVISLGHVSNYHQSPEKYSDLHENLDEKALQRHIHCSFPLFIVLSQLLMQGNRMHWLLCSSLLCTFTFRNQKPWNPWGRRVSAALTSVCYGNCCGHQYSETPWIWRTSSRCPESS